MGMSGVGEDSRGRASSRPLFGAGLFLAVGATVALVFTEDMRWLRLGIIAALWAALIGGFIAARYRRQAATSEQTAAQAQEIYELELEREIAARREFELEAQAQARDRAEDDAKEELEALRSEVTALRESLQALFGGEVLWERVALTAQSTRMRSLSEEPRVVTAGDSNGGKPAQITAGRKLADIAERPTELIAAIRDLDAEPSPQESGPGANQPEGQQVNRSEQPRTRFVPRPSRPVEESRPSQRPVEPATRRVRPVDRGGLMNAREAAARARAEASRPRQQPVERPAARAEPPRPEQPPAEPRGVRPGNQPKPPPSQPPPSRSTQHAPARSRPPAEPTRPAMDPTHQDSPAAGPQRPRPRQPEPELPTELTGALDPDSLPTRTKQPVTEPERQGRRARHEPAEPRTRITEPTRPEPNPTLPPEIRDLGSRPGGRRRRAEPDDEIEVPHVSSGRRHRAEDDPASWRAFGDSTGAREPVSDTGTGRRRARESTEEADKPSGSHAEGRSVSELLAAHGAGATTPRRRRRADD